MLFFHLRSCRCCPNVAMRGRGLLNQHRVYFTLRCDVPSRRQYFFGCVRKCCAVAGVCRCRSARQLAAKGRGHWGGLVRPGAVAGACGACEPMRPVAALLGSHAGVIPEASQRHPRGIPEAYQRHTRGKPRGKPQRQTLLHEKIYMFCPERMPR